MPCLVFCLSDSLAEFLSAAVPSQVRWWSATPPLLVRAKADPAAGSPEEAVEGIREAALRTERSALVLDRCIANEEGAEAWFTCIGAISRANVNWPHMSWDEIHVGKTREGDTRMKGLNCLS